jgi:hypothetical protein
MSGSKVVQIGGHTWHVTTAEGAVYRVVRNSVGRHTVSRRIEAHGLTSRHWRELRWASAQSVAIVNVLLAVQRDDATGALDCELFT